MRCQLWPSRLVVVFPVFSCALAAASLPPAREGDAQPSAAELICHTDSSAECYPRVFRPTHEFQTVHDDQELPPGLHVRLNVWTGEREAKVNVPGELPASEGLALDSAVVVAEPEQASAPQIPRGAPAYEAVGKVKTPRDESLAFYDALAVLRAGTGAGGDDAPLGAALGILEDLSHDIYYGLKIAEDNEALKSLLCMMSAADVFLSSKGDSCVARAYQSAAIVGASLQNNPTALAVVEGRWGDLKRTSCPGADATLDAAIFSMLLPRPGLDPRGLRRWEDATGLTKVKASALNGLVKSPPIRADFLDGAAMSQILHILVADLAVPEDNKRKLANLVLDNFLDEDMGATPGEWPRSRDGGAGETCRLDHDGGKDGSCWELHMEKLAGEHAGEEEHWSRALWEALRRRKTARPAGGRGPAEPRDEL